MIKIISNTNNTVIGHYYNNQRLNAVEYLKSINRKHSYKIMNIFYKNNYDKQMSFNKFLEYFSLDSKFNKQRQFSLIE